MSAINDALTNAENNMLAFLSSASDEVIARGGLAGTENITGILNGIKTLASYERTITTHIHSSGTHPVISGTNINVNTVQEGMSFASLIANGITTQIVTAQGNNLIDKAKVTSAQYLNWVTGLGVTSTSSNTVSGFIKIPSLSTYAVISGLTYIQTEACGLAWYDSYGNYVAGVSFTGVTGNGKYAPLPSVAPCYLKVTINTIDLATAQIELNSAGVASSYVAFVPKSPSPNYKASFIDTTALTISQSTTITLSQPLYGLSDDTHNILDIISAAYTQNVYQLLINGSGTWTDSNVNSSRVWISMPLTNLGLAAILPSSDSIVANIMCNGMSVLSASDVYASTDYAIGITAAGNLVISIPLISATTLATALTWLAANQITIRYKLATSITSIGAPQKVIAFLGTNNIVANNGSLVSVQLAGNIHTLNGNFVSSHIEFAATADYISGDTFSIGGIEIAGVSQDGKSLPNKFFKTGYWVLGAKYADSKLFLSSSLSNGGYIRSDTAPENTNLIWIDSSNDNTSKYYSPAIPWTSSTLLPPSGYRASCYGNGIYVALSATRFIYSTDGITWVETLLHPSSDPWCSVCYGNGKFVAVASGINVAAYSTDGITWTTSTLPSLASWCSVCYGNGKFVAVSSDNGNVAVYSTDGITWTTSTLPSTGQWQSVCYGNGKFVAIVNGNVAAYSTDGITWTASIIPNSTSWCSVCYGNGKFVAVSSGSTTAAYSLDGITWTAATLPSSSNWCSVCYGNGKFITIANSTTNSVAYSTDGITWLYEALPTSIWCKTICFGNGKFVMPRFNGAMVIYCDAGGWVKASAGHSSEIVEKHAGLAISTYFCTNVEYNALVAASALDPNTCYVITDDVNTTQYVPATVKDMTYYVNITNGLDTNDGLSSSTAFKTIMHAVNLIPQIVNHNIIINAAAGTYPEDLKLPGFMGKGSITIIGGTDTTTALNFIVQSAAIINCTNKVSVNYFSANSAISGWGSFYSWGSQYARFIGCVTTFADSLNAGFTCAVGEMIMQNCISSNKIRSIEARDDGHIHVSTSTGTGNTTVYTVGALSKITLDSTSIITGTSLFNLFNGGEVIGFDGKSTAGYSPALNINPDFSVNQRAQVFYPNANTYSVDRWQNYGISTIITPNNPGINISCTATAPSNLITSPMEDKDYLKLAGKTVTASIKYKNLSLGSNTSVNINISDGTISVNANLTGTSGIVSATITLSNNPTRLSLGMTKQGTGSAFSVDIEYFKLELGSVATPFVSLPYAENLEMCQRYYEKQPDILVLTHTGDSELRYTFPFMVTKRVTPTLVVNSPNGTVGKVGRYNGSTWDDFSYNSAFISDTTTNKYTMDINGFSGTYFFCWYLSADSEIY